MKTISILIIALFIACGLKAQETSTEKEFYFENPVTKEKTKIASGYEVEVHFKKPKVTATGSVIAISDSSLTLSYYQQPYRQVVPFINIASLKVISGAKKDSQPNESEKSTSLRFSVGYGFPSGSALVGQSSNILYGPTSNTRNSKGIYGTYGTGVVLSASYNMMFSKIVGLDLGLQYLIGKEYKDEYNETSNFPGNVTTFQNSNVASSHGLFFSPSLVFQTGEGKFRPYLKTGFVIGTVKVNVNESTTSSGNGSTQTQTRTIEYTGGMPLGFKGALGAEFGVAKKVNFFAEISFVSLSYYPHKGEMTEYKENGVDQLNTLQTYQKVTMFDNETSSNGMAPNPDEPSHTLRQSLPMGSISFNAGLRLMLGR